MKTTYLLILTFLFSYNLQAQISIKPIDFVGKWKMVDNWNSVTIVSFSTDNYVSIKNDDIEIDGKNFIIKGGENDGKSAQLKYAINYEVEPILLQIIGFLDIEEKHILLIPIKPINDDEFLCIVNFDEESEIDFTDNNKENIVKATRIK